MLALTAAAEERHLAAAALFATLLNLKHIFLYAAPAFFVFLLRRYCRWGWGRGWGVQRPPDAETCVAPGLVMHLCRFMLCCCACHRGCWHAVRQTAASHLPRPCSGPRAVPRFLALGALVAAIFGASLGPFAAAGQLPQLLRRLFPFARGLCHAYWAPNVWALYAAADKLLSAALGRHGSAASMTGEWVGEGWSQGWAGVARCVGIAQRLQTSTRCEER